MDTPVSHEPVAPVAVWDRAVRLFHWALVLAVLAALILGFFAPPRLLDFHAWAGYAALALVAFRLVWGLTGSTFARFSAFRPSLHAVMAHLRGTAGSGYGHNPLGALMVYALLAIVAAIGASGLVVLGGVERQGPLVALTGFATGAAAREIHEMLAFALVGLIVLHVGGVAFESRREAENLVRAMITGRKRPRADATPRRDAQPVVAVLALTAIGVTVAGTVAWLNSLPTPAVPAGPALAEWTTECGDCHAPHHPSLLPADKWAAIMATLDDHFGEDASLDADKAARIGGWLAAHAAENYDTKASNLFRLADPADPLRVTATTRWKRIHGDIPAEIFKRKDIGGPVNCTACHGDAEAGLFSPQRIRIPQPPKEPS